MHSTYTTTYHLQINAFAAEQDMYNLKKECEEKDATIRELTAILQSCDAAASKVEDSFLELIHVCS